MFTQSAFIQDAGVAVYQGDIADGDSIWVDQASFVETPSWVVSRSHKYMTNRASGVSAPILFCGTVAVDAANGRFGKFDGRWVITGYKCDEVQATDFTKAVQAEFEAYCTWDMSGFDPTQKAAFCCEIEIDPKEMVACDMIVVQLQIKTNEKGIIQQLALNYGATQTEDTF